ncbi:MAG: hypothetical protein LBT46_02535 [Planctomycetaceae bacterium]|jgi:phospholipase/carboxylesterase|nr:hypothetical protein [Planctomycetaceae bacterium]
MPTLTQSQTPKKNKTKIKTEVPQRLSDSPVLNINFETDFLPNNTSGTLPYSLFIPLHYEPRYAYPLLVWLHPSGEDERQLMKIMPQISLRNYVAAAPQGMLLDESAGKNTSERTVLSMMHRTKKNYGWLNDAGSLDEIEGKVFDCITLAQERCSIAAHKIFLAGFGSGGESSLRLAMMYPERFAGAALFGGVVPDDFRLFPLWQKNQPLNILLGIGQSVDAAACRSIETLHAAGAAVEIAEYPDINSATAEMLRDLNRWMMNIVAA